MNQKKFGTISWSGWEAYTWKNELVEHKTRILQFVDHVVEQKDTDYNPFHQLQRSIGIASLCMRRLIECRLVTDKFRDSQILAYEVLRRKDGPRRGIFNSETAGDLHLDYNLSQRIQKPISPKSISDKFLHARIIAVLADSDYLPDGLLLASDDQLKGGLFHFTTHEISSIFDGFLSNFVEFESERRQLNSDGYWKIISTRE